MRSTFSKATAHPQVLFKLSVTVSGAADPAGRAAALCWATTADHTRWQPITRWLTRGSTEWLFRAAIIYPSLTTLFMAARNRLPMSAFIYGDREVTDALTRGSAATGYTL